ncbi:hypothetical protein [Tistlia consotensis]|uniref:hypothetical protein n=1 Tax=Tistlia consotensis TaxID=1321365 RepID=UPI00117DCD67|nr:hypothetical protein [Tistlia consotensis]
MFAALTGLTCLAGGLSVAPALAADCTFDDAPADLSHISPAPAGTPADYARWVGAYSGDAWGGSALCGTFVVNSVDPKAHTAEVIYAHGKFLPWNLPSPKQYDVTARFIGDGAARLRVDLPWHATAFYTYAGDAVDGIYGSSKIHLKRIK